MPTDDATKIAKQAKASATLVYEQAEKMVQERVAKGQETLDAIYVVCVGNGSPVNHPAAANELFKMLASAMPSTPALIMVPRGPTKKKPATVSSRRKASAKRR